MEITPVMIQRALFRYRVSKMSEDRPLRRRNCVDGCGVFPIISKQIRWTNDPRKSNAHLRTTALRKMHRQQPCPSRNRRRHCPLIGLKHFCWGSWLDLPTNRIELGTCLRRDAERGGFDYEGTRAFILQEVAIVEEPEPVEIGPEEQLNEENIVAIAGDHGADFEAEEVVPEVLGEESEEEFEELEEVEEIEEEAVVVEEQLLEVAVNQQGLVGKIENENCEKTVKIWAEQEANGILAEWLEDQPVHQPSVATEDNLETASFHSLPSSNGSNYSLPESISCRSTRWEDIKAFWSLFTEVDEDAPVSWEFPELDEDDIEYFEEQQV